MPTSLRKTIAAAVNASPLSQAEIARRAGISPQRLCDYLSCRRDLYGEVVGRLLVALDISAQKSGRPGVITSEPPPSEGKG